MEEKLIKKLSKNNMILDMALDIYQIKHRLDQCEQRKRK